MKKLTAIFVLAIITAVFTACSTGNSDNSAKAPPKMQTITLGILPDVNSIPFIIAQEKGFFREAGLTVQLLAFKSAVERDSALQSGHLDGANSDILAEAFMKEGGINTIITSLTNGSFKLVVNKDIPAASINDLKGKDVGISKNTIIEYVTDKMLAEARMQPSDINKIIIPQLPARLEMLKSGKIAAAVLPDPLATVAVQNGAKLLNSTDQLGINPGIFLFSAKAVREKRNEIQAVYKAYNKAVDYLSREPAESYIDILTTKGGFPNEVRGSLILPVYQKASVPDPKDVAAVIKWLEAKQLIKQTYTYHDLVDTSAVQ